MALFSNNRNGGIMDVIRCDESSYLIWKWRPYGSQLGGTTKENAIRWGSSLRVKDGSLAVFVYNQADGIAQDYIMGPFDGIIKTDNLPVLSNIVGLAYDGSTPFQAEIYFINLAQIIQTRFAVPYFDVYDPRFLDYSVPVAVRGTITFKITDYKEFIRLHRLDNFTLEAFQTQVKDAVSRYVKQTITNAPAEYGIPVIQLERKVSEINERIGKDLGERLHKDFGVTVTGIDIGAIDIDRTGSDYAKLARVTQEITAKTIEAEAAAKIKEIEEDQRLSIKQREIEIDEAGYAKHKQTQMSNFAAYQVEAMEHVGVAGAESLGQMGSGDAGSSGGSGLNPAAMMVGMSVGGAIGQNLASSISTATAIGGHPVTAPGSMPTPPPLPRGSYYIVVNNQPVGPYEIDVLRELVANGQLTKDSLVWKEGMVNWLKASEDSEVMKLFPPTIPDL